MTTRLLPKSVLAAVAAMGLFLPFGAPLPGSCMRTIGIAGAAPSPSCGGDLRECLRLSADMRQTTFGGRYVTADDVARCMEAFNACANGGASRGGNPVPPTTTPEGSGARTGLPERFVIKATDVDYDCRLNGDSVTCSIVLRTKFEGTDFWSASFAGERAGLIVTGSVTGQQRGHAPGDPSCRYEQDFSGPARYVFSLDGTVRISEGPYQNQQTLNGSCNGSDEYPSEKYESTGTWSASE